MSGSIPRIGSLRRSDGLGSHRCASSAPSCSSKSICFTCTNITQPPSDHIQQPVKPGPERGGVGGGFGLRTSGGRPRGFRSPSPASSSSGPKSAPSVCRAAAPNDGPPSSSASSSAPSTSNSPSLNNAHTRFPSCRNVSVFCREGFCAPELPVGFGLHAELELCVERGAFGRGIAGGLNPLTTRTPLQPPPLPLRNTKRGLRQQKT